ncbi:MAG: SynChlorMet cassette protein ScmC [Dehalobacter sp.]|nr:SynChlorMet cassette protein ScmC [Dehalobacter sp.]
MYNGHCWRLTAPGDAARWLKKMANIMRLETTGQVDCHGLSFIVCDPDNADFRAYIPGDLPKENWAVRKLRPVHLLYHNEAPDIVCCIGTKLSRFREYESMACSLAPIVERVIQTGGAPFHSGLIVRDGYGVLLMGHPKIGKSTCCRRVPAPWEAWCDDNTLLIGDDDGNYHAHPLPTFGDFVNGNVDTTWDVKAHIPVKAIFLLEQSGADKAIPINRAPAALSIYHSALRGCMNIVREPDYQPLAVNRDMIFKNICSMAQKTPAFKLLVSKEGKFWEEIERVMRGI